MYKKINITENTLGVLALFTKGFDKEYYIREVKNLLKISPRTSQLILENLESKGVLKSKIRGNIKSYKINRTRLTREYFIFVEQYKLITFLEKKEIIREIIEKINPHVHGIGIIFGSYVKEINKKDSDLDIFIVGDYDKKEIKEISNKYGIEINVKSYSLKIFEEELFKDILLKEILDNHVIFKKTEDFLERILKNE